ncbi:hypothetical protein REPUB_Repub19eG0026400 [Reevesia pubescens]
MDSFEFDNVKAEKEDALWRYDMERKLRIGFRFIGFFVVLFLLSWSWFPSLINDTVAVAGDFRRCFISTFNKPLFTFVVVNIIIVVVYFLSKQKQTQKQSTTPDIYDEYVSCGRSIPKSAVATATTTKEETTVDKQIILVENAVAVSPVKQQQGTNVDTVTKTKISLSPVKQQQQQPRTTIRTVTKTKPDVSSSTDNDQVKQKEYRRTRSMVSESRNQRRPPREFRRSDTAMISRELVMISGTEPPRKLMDEMSSEEFQSKIDSFIAETKKTLMQENTAQFTKRKEKCMSIMVKT